jgi:hypothetical protein
MATQQVADMRAELERETIKHAANLKARLDRQEALLRDTFKQRLAEVSADHSGTTWTIWTI